MLWQPTARTAGAGRQRGTYDIFDYWRPRSLDTALIRHLAGVVPRFRRVMEQAQA